MKKTPCSGGAERRRNDGWAREIVEIMQKEMERDRHGKQEGKQTNDTALEV